MATSFSKFDEYHPFSILAVIDHGREIKLGIKKCGDFTTKLMQLKRGAFVKIKGVYGHMTAPHNSYPVVTIAGKILGKSLLVLVCWSSYLKLKKDI